MSYVHVPTLAQRVAYAACDAEWRTTQDIADRVGRDRYIGSALGALERNGYLLGRANPDGPPLGNAEWRRGWRVLPIT